MGKDAAYNAEKGAGPQSPNPFPSVPGSLIILYRPNRVTVPKMQSLRHTVAREPLTCGAGTCVPRVPEIRSLPQTAAREPITCGAGTRVPRVPEMQVYHTLRRGNQSHEAREPVSRKFPKCMFTIDCGAGTSHMRRGNRAGAPKEENRDFLFFLSFGGCRFCMNVLEWNRRHDRCWPHEASDFGWRILAQLTLQQHWRLLSVVCRWFP